MKFYKKIKLLLTLSFVIAISVSIYLYYSCRPRNFNIILITLDSVRPDHLGRYGYKRNVSPNINKLAEETILFTQAISGASWACPSIHSLITSTYSSKNGVYFWDQLLLDSVPTLPEVLKERDYCTGFISGHGALSGIDLFKRGFDTIDDMENVRVGALTYKALVWIGKNKNKKFFLWLHYMDAHDKLLDFPQGKHSIKNITTQEAALSVLKYDRAISYVDNNIGILLGKLRESGLYRTIQS